MDELEKIGSTIEDIDSQTLDLKNKKTKLKAEQKRLLLKIKELEASGSNHKQHKM